MPNATQRAEEVQRNPMKTKHKVGECTYYSERERERKEKKNQTCYDSELQSAKTLTLEEFEKSRVLQFPRLLPQKPDQLLPQPEVG